MLSIQGKTGKVGDDTSRNVNRFEPAYTDAQLIGKKRFVNSIMDEELKIYQVDVEEKFKESEMRNYCFPRSTPQPEQKSVSSKEALSKLLQGIAKH